MKGKLVTLFVLLGSIGLLQAACRNCNTCKDGEKVKVEQTAQKGCNDCNCGCPFSCCSCK
ncbi:MAG TPA: hypothetical protein QGF02_04025 [Candidatus Babeliales bacterium]|nr:hypothetical protein [Candidatus Babeliales bacterium]